MLTGPFYAWYQNKTLLSGTEEAQAEVQTEVTLRSSGICEHLNTLGKNQPAKSVWCTDISMIVEIYRHRKPGPGKEKYSQINPLDPNHQYTGY